MLDLFGELILAVALVVNNVFSLEQLAYFVFPLLLALARLLRHQLVIVQVSQNLLFPMFARRLA
jgi:hypothetical protein